MNNQEFFDKSVKYFKDNMNKGPCVDEDGTCVYDDGKGRHCVIGSFLPADSPINDYRGSITKLYHHDIYKEEILNIFGDVSLELMSQIQYVHDNISSNLNIKKIFDKDKIFNKLVSISEYFGLNKDCLKDF